MPTLIQSRPSSFRKESATRLSKESATRPCHEAPVHRPEALNTFCRRLFLVAYGCSGAAGLIYQVSWTRWLSLHMGHSTAATSTVVAAVMGGLAGGAVAGARLASRLSRRQAIYAYCVLEAMVAVMALTVPDELRFLQPLLARSYQDGMSGTWFPAVRLVTSLVVIGVPAIALGATFPIASRLFVGRWDSPGSSAGTLYAVNATGASLGALAAGFVLVPALGVRRTVLIAIAIAGLGILCAWILTLRSDADPAGVDVSRRDRTQNAGAVRRAKETVAPHRLVWLTFAAMGAAGFAGMTQEIVWTRLLSMTVGPTTYAFSATVAAIIAGIALGSGLGSWAVKRTHRPVFWLALMLTFAAIAASGASIFGGAYLPKAIAFGVASSSGDFNQLLPLHSLMAAALILPVAAGLGAAFPFALEISAGGVLFVERRVGDLYAVNTVAGVAGALLTGFIAIPRLGLEWTLQFANVLVIGAGFALGYWGGLGRRDRVISFVFSVGAIVLLFAMPRWDRGLLANGVYKYPAYLEKGVDVELALKAGELLYYREGAAGTVSVKRLAGRKSLAIDGKVDASDSADMLTQKALAHIPLLLHPNPRDVFVIGLGSGVTLGSALVHPISRADVAELSPEVVAASRFFSEENRNALADKRTRLILGDGRTHLQLSARTYDVIISEPSNPWMAGVASLFTREFFQAARSRLAPGGILCQWAHTYDITDGDLRSIVATVRSVFSHVTVWIIGGTDVLLLASDEPIEPLLDNISRGWVRPGVEADLRQTHAMGPFAVLSLYAGGPADLERYAADAGVQDDDRMALEFSGPRAISLRSDVDNTARLRSVVDPGSTPAIITRARASASAADWRDRATMLSSAEDYPSAYEDYARSVQMDQTDLQALDGLVRTSVVVGRESDALRLLKPSTSSHANVPAIAIAASRILAGGGAFEDAVATLKDAAAISPADPGVLAQLASIHSDAGDLRQLERVVAELRRVEPYGWAALYYSAVVALGEGHFDRAIRLIERAIEVDPLDSAAHNLLGAAHANLGHTAEASKAFQAALRINPREATTYVNLGLLELGQQNPAVATALFVEALSLDPTSDAARQGLTKAQNNR